MSWYKIHNKGESQPAEVLLYGEIGGGWDGSGVEFEAFAKELANIPAKQNILMRIHSPGGSVFDGLAMYNLLAERREYLTARIDGLAASAASWIALAAKRVEMPRHARMMIHDAQGFAVGDSEAMQEMADLLERESDKIAGIYADKTGKSQAKMREMMRATTWMDGVEALAQGFVDVVIEADAVKNEFDLSRFANVPAETGGQSSAENKPNKPIQYMENKVESVAEVKTTAAEIKLENVVSKADFEALQNKLQSERKARITSELTPLCANRGIDPAPFIEMALKGDAEEATARKAINAVPEAGGASVGVVENKGNPVIEQYKALEPGAARNQFRSKHRDGLVNAMAQFDSVRNANTIAAGLVNDYMADGLIVAAHNKLAPLNAFTREFTTDPMKPRATVDVRSATAGATAQSNATNFESGDSTLAAVSVTVNQLSVSYHLLNSELNQGSRLEHLAQINANQLADKISDAVTALMIVANYGAATVIGSAANFDSADLPPIMALAKNYSSKNLLLDGGHLAYLLPTDRQSFRLGEQGAYGFDIIAEQNRWTGAVANTAGFVCGPEAIAIASGRSVELPSGQFESIGTVVLPQGITVQTTTWYNTAGRVWWAAYDLMFGAAVGDATQAEVLVTA